MSDPEEIRDLLIAAAKAVPIGSKWQHKKGGQYQVVGHGYDTEAGRVNVHYTRYAGPNYRRDIDGWITWDRPLFMWEEPRFVRI